ncbi:GNAT family N-acetyltransferase, partial [Chloroflexota bacterium]
MDTAKVRIITHLEEFRVLKDTWDSILSKYPKIGTIYLTYEWLWTWWKHFGNKNKLNVVLIEKGCNIIGIIPLMKATYRIGLIKLHVLETIGSNNCNYIGLILPEHVEDAMIIFLDYLKEELVNNGSVLRLNWVPQNSIFLNSLIRHSKRYTKHITTLAPYLLLPTKWDDYFSSIGQRRRKILRRSLRSLEKEHIVEFRQITPDTL